MSRKADGKPKLTERVTFTRPAAERIAKAVRSVEAGDRSQPGITFGGAGGAGGGGKTFRMCTFTGAWSKNALKTVMLRGTTATLSASNLFATITASASARNCAIARDGTTWYLIAAEC